MGRRNRRPDEVFTLATDILAVDGPTAVVRAEVRYGDPPRQKYRDLWDLRLAGDGRCAWFEEWALLARAPTLRTRRFGIASRSNVLNFR